MNGDGDRDGDDPGGPRGEGLAALLGAALREATADREGERRAVAAFQEARDTGACPTRTRRRDDWRPTGGEGVQSGLRGEGGA
ncbi:hypothetical protein [Streptomyces sp. NPDC005423]|uniref:hypothetical protein n=1 Tax=Streptomyces sp. NPDC005423 TaxID=3155343 RepID=UPI0033BDD163